MQISLKSGSFLCAQLDAHEANPFCSSGHHQQATRCASQWPPPPCPALLPSMAAARFQMTASALPTVQAIQALAGPHSACLCGQEWPVQSGSLACVSTRTLQWVGSVLIQISPWAASADSPGSPEAHGWELGVQLLPVPSAHVELDLWV